MILGAEIGLLVYGIIALVRQKFSMGKRGDVTGWRAVILGLICISVLPFIIAMGIVVGIFLAVQQIEVSGYSLVWIDIVGLVVAFASVAILGRIFLKQQEAEGRLAATMAPLAGVGTPLPFDGSNPYSPTQRPPY